MPLIGQAPSARSLLAGVFGRLRGFGPPAPLADPVATSIAVSPNGASIGLAQTQQLSATILDQYGQPFSGTVSWSTGNAAIATVSTGGLVTPVAYGSVTITATFNALSTGVTLTVQQPTQLAITTQPSGGVTGSAFGAQPVVRLRDAGGVNVAEAGRTVTATIQSGSGTLTGTTAVNTDANGVATFTNLAIEATSPPANFALAFSCTGLTGATSSTFAISESNTLFSNEPSDLSLTFERQFSALDEGGNLAYFESAIVQDATAPYSPPNVMQFRFPAGNAEGGGGLLEGPEWSAAQNVRRFYTGLVWKLSSNFQVHAIVLKVIYPLRATGASSETADHVFGIVPIGSTTTGTMQFRIETQSGVGTPLFGENINPSSLVRDTWYLTEYYVEMNTPGVANGVARWWHRAWNGTSWSAPVLAADHSTVGFSSAGEPGRWSRWRISAYQGGAPGAAWPSDQFMYLDAQRLSVGS